MRLSCCLSILAATQPIHLRQSHEDYAPRLGFLVILLGSGWIAGSYFSPSGIIAPSKDMTKDN